MVPAASRLRLSRPILDGPAAPPQGARLGGTSGNGRPPALRASPGCRDRRWPGVLAVAVLAALVGGSVACGGQHSEFAASASPPPAISAIRPDLAVAGVSAAITVTGAHLNEARVTVNGATVAISSDAAASLALTIPGTLLAVGAADMVVTTADGSASAKIPVMAPGNVAAADNPQVAVYSLSVPVAANVAVQFGPTTAYGWPTAAQPVPAGGSANLFVAGMQANVTYHMQARITLPDGSVVLDQDHTFTPVGPDPALLPPPVLDPQN